MNMRRSWRRVFLYLLAFVICFLGFSSKPAPLSAQTPATLQSRAREAQSYGILSLEATQNVQVAPQPQKPVTAGDAYMNIQVLAGIPSDELLPAMRYITSALGVSCDFCHDPKSFESDDKAEKATARKMMVMMFTINKDNFNGHREVTCYTCHRGAFHPVGTPLALAVALANEPAGAMPPANAGPGNPPTASASAPGTPGAANSATSSPLPTLDAVLSKYTDALGGSNAIQKMTSVSEKGTMEIPAHGMHGTLVEEYRKAPNQAVAIVHTSDGDLSQGYNGTGGWQNEPHHGAEDFSGDELVRAREWAAFIPALDLKQNFIRAQVVAIDKIGDRDAYRIVASRSGGGQVRFYFDKDSGLLLRISVRIESPLGALPEETSFSDYKDVNGVKIPFTVLVAHADGPTIYRWDQIQANISVDDSRFNKPASKPAQ